MESLDLGKLVLSGDIIIWTARSKVHVQDAEVGIIKELIITAQGILGLEM